MENVIMGEVNKSSAAEELKSIQEQKAKLDAREKELKEQTRVGDLEEVKRLCKLHEITATELRTVLKKKGRGAKKSTGTKSSKKKTTK